MFLCDLCDLCDLPRSMCFVKQAVGIGPYFRHNICSGTCVFQGVCSMGAGTTVGWKFRLAAGVIAALGLTHAAAAAVPDEVTFTKHIAPILQRSCENCHRPAGVAPMSLVTYEDVRPWARGIKQRTGIGPKAGVMPPWYVERNIGIQKFHNDPSLSEDEIATIAKWVDTGAVRGNPADMPPPKQYADDRAWAIGTPDLIIKMQELEVKGNAPDWWGEVPSVPTGLTEDRYVAALEIKEVNDVDTKAGSGRATVGGRFVFHHMIWRTQVLDGKTDQAQDPLAIFTDEESVNWPVHEVGRNADFFDPKSARPAEGRLEHRLRLGPPPLERARHEVAPRDRLQADAEGLSADLQARGLRPRQRRRHRHQGDGSQPAAPRLHGAAAAHQAHLLRAAPPRARRAHVPRGDLGLQHPDAQLRRLRSQLGARLRLHGRLRAAAPEGTILHIVGYMDNSPTNKNVPDPRNWQGSGNRSVANMFIDLGSAWRSPTNSSRRRWPSGVRISTSRRTMS
jgi:hypothetical protein